MPEWLQNPVVVFGLAIGAMFFGYFFGLFEGRGQGYKRRKAEEAEEKNEPGELISEPLPPASPEKPSDRISLLDVSVDNAGQLRLKLDGQRIEAESMDAGQRKRMISVLTQIRPWLETSKSAPPPARPKPVSSPRAVPPSPGIPTPTPRPAPASNAAAPPPANDKKESAPGALSIVGQIDSILQEHTAGTPLMDKGIRLQESREGGVIVWVGIDKFATVDDVPDEQIKGAIRAAIGVWESKYTPGL